MSQEEFSRDNIQRAGLIFTGHVDKLLKIEDEEGSPIRREFLLIKIDDILKGNYETKLITSIEGNDSCRTVYKDTKFFVFYRDVNGNLSSSTTCDAAITDEHKQQLIGKTYPFNEGKSE